MLHESALKVLPPFNSSLRLPVEDEVGGRMRPQIVLELLAKLHPSHYLRGRKELQKIPEDNMNMHLNKA